MFKRIFYSLWRFDPNISRFQRLLNIVHRVINNVLLSFISISRAKYYFYEPYFVINDKNDYIPNIPRTTEGVWYLMNLFMSF